MMTVHNTCKLDPIAIMTIFMLLLCINLPTGDSLEYLLDITPLGNIRYWEAGEIKSGLVGDPIQSPWSDWRGEQPRKHHCSRQSQRILSWKFAPVDGEECWQCQAVGCALKTRETKTAKIEQKQCSGTGNMYADLLIYFF